MNHSLIAVIIGLIIIFIGLIMLIHSAYFYICHQKPIDKAVMSSAYIEKGLIFGMLEQMMYGSYCLFPKLAKRDGFYELFSTLDKHLRYHLIFHWVCLVLMGVLMVSAFLVDKLLGY